MEYERIHKTQTGPISPSKLRMKLLGAHSNRRKEGGTNSSRTSPSKLEELEFAKNSLLASGNADEEGSSAACFVMPNSVKELLNPKVSDTNAKVHTTETRTQYVSKGINNQEKLGNSSMVHPVRSLEEDNNDYDSEHEIGSSSTFEFHKDERTITSSAVGHLSRPLPSKWNDAEKWIVSRQTTQPNLLRKTLLQSQPNRPMISSWARVAPESVNPEQRSSAIQAAETKKIDSYQRTLRNPVDKFSFAPSESHTSVVASISANTVPLNACKESILEEHSITERPIANATGISSAKSVCMRDMGTEMTPVASQDPSRTGTPIGATTPTRSPDTSKPSTPKKGAQVKVASDQSKLLDKSNNELSEQEFRRKTRSEIVALGIKLGKMNIAAWASKDDSEHAPVSQKAVDEDQLKTDEFEARAAAWEEAEKSKHLASFKREEVKIQAWEGHEKAKCEAEMGEVEVRIEQMRVHAHEKMMKNLARTNQQVQAKLAAAEARRNRQAARTAKQVEQIRHTGHVPPANFFCCGWLS